MFRLPMYAPPSSFSPQDAYMNHPRGTQGAASMVQNPDTGQMPPQGVLGQQDQSQGLLGQQAQGAVSGSGPGIMPFANNPSLANAIQQQPNLGRYLNRGMGTSPGPVIRGMPQSVKPPPLLGPNPQRNRIAGVQMP